MSKKTIKSFGSYEKTTQHHMIRPSLNRRLARLLYVYTCLSEEVGEIGGVLKRIARDNGGKVTREVRAALGKECGDVFWTLTRLVKKLGFSMTEIASDNAKKINDRVKRGKIKGSGDDR